MTARARGRCLWGAGGTFCAGADLKGMADGRGNRTVPPETGEAYDPLAADGPMGPTRMQLSKPVIAAIAGHAVAGGLELALWCDLRVAAEDAVFGVFCRRWGVPLIDGGTIRLPRLIGQSRALDMILTGRAVGAEEAFEMGLANRRREERRSARTSGRTRPRYRADAADLPARRQIVRIRTIRSFAGRCARQRIRAWRADARKRRSATRARRRFASGKGRGGSFENI